MLSDWFHTEGREQAAGLEQDYKHFKYDHPRRCLRTVCPLIPINVFLTSAPACLPLVPCDRWTGDPNSILINGKTANSTCTAVAVDDIRASCGNMERVVIEPNKRYLFRFIGATSLDMVDVAIDGHEFEVVESVRRQ